MKVIPYLLLLASGLSLSGCSNSFAAPQEPTKSPKDGPPAPPSILLSLNNADEAAVTPGNVLLIDAVVATASGRDSGKPITLSSPTGGWGSLVTIEVKDSQGKAVPGMTLKPAFVTENSINLDRKTLGQLIWTFEPGPGKSLAAGEYSFVAHIDSNAGSWEGKASSTPAKLIVKQALTPDEERLAALAEIQTRTILKESPQAIEAADRFLSAHADDALMLEAKADALASIGKLKEAVAIYNQAIANLKPQSEDSVLREPPFALLRKQQLAEDALKKG